MTERQDIIGREIGLNCIGCSIADGSYVPPGGIIRETENFMLHQDPEIPIKGFLIIPSKRCMKSISEMSESEATELVMLCRDARRALLSFEDIIRCDIIQEERGHFHLWIFPVYKWMTDMFGDSLDHVRPIMRYAKENMKTEENIREILGCVERIRKCLSLREGSGLLGSGEDDALDTELFLEYKREDIDKEDAQNETVEFL